MKKTDAQDSNRQLRDKEKLEKEDFQENLCFIENVYNHFCSINEL